MTKQRGFTLVELAITVLVIGILSAAMSGVFSRLSAMQQAAYIEKHAMNNRMIGSALVNYAANSTTLGTLPAPYTGSGYTSTVYNPADVTAPGIALTQELAKTGISPGEINDDNTGAHAVRVYQRVTGLTKQVPLYFQSGPLVTLTYQYGVLYMTTCPKATATCNPTPATGLPGSSIALTTGNYSTYVSTSPDLDAFSISSLPVQNAMLGTTVQRLDKVRDVLLGYLRTAQQTAAAGDGTNWYPTGAVSKGGATPGTNQGCRDGWYNLSTDTVILNTLGLSPSEYGTTAWGGAIEYCRDYDPTASKAANASPHYAAIRILSSVSTGSAPDAVVTGNNVVLTF